MLNRIWKIILLGCFVVALTLVTVITWASSREEVKAEEILIETPSQFMVQVADGLLSLDVKDAELVQVLREIGRQANIDITIDATLTGRINLRLTDVTVEAALKQICANRALVYEYHPAAKSFRIIKVGAYAGQKGEPKAHDSSPEEKQTQAGSAQHPAFETEKGVSGRAQDKALNSRGQAEKVLDRRGRPMYKTGELLVKFNADATAEQITAFNQNLGLTSIDFIRRLQIHTIQLPAGMPEQKAIELYVASGLVEIAERHALRYPDQTPNDPYFSEQWGLPKIMAPEAWNVTTGGQETVIAVIDTGVDFLHPDLADNIWVNNAELNGLPNADDDGNGYVDDTYGYDFADDDAVPMDVDGHGTHVAGIIAARGNNEIGVAGACWQARIMVLKVQADGADNMEDAAIIKAMTYAAEKGARIVNCSFGGAAFSQSQFDAFNYLRNADILSVCAAGNDGINTDLAGNEHYPSDYDLSNIVSVAAGDQTDALADFSNYGFATVDLVAPGVGILSPIAAGPYTDARVAVDSGSGPVLYQAVGMTYSGATDAGGITASIYECAFGYPADFPVAVSGNIALIQRGILLFSEKVANAQNAGAVAVIVYNNVPGSFSGTLMSPGNWVPAVGISQEDGAALLEYGTVTTTVINEPVDDISFYGYKSGTSMATPQVAGVAGLITALNPALDYSQVKAIMLSSVDHVQALESLVATGGRLNAFNALLAAILPVDLSCDQRIGIEDAIVAFQVAVGLNPAVCPAYLAAGLDVDGDNRIGLAEALYILQLISELRN